MVHSIWGTSPVVPVTPVTGKITAAMFVYLLKSINFYFNVNSKPINKKQNKIKNGVLFYEDANYLGNSQEIKLLNHSVST